MTRALEKNSTITLYSRGIPTVFTIKAILGWGATGVVYSVEYSEDSEVSHRGVLKEYCPVRFESKREGERLVIPDEHIADFREGKKKFKENYVKINQYLNCSSIRQIHHPFQLGFYEGSTSYRLVSADSGICYEDVQEESLEMIVERMIDVTTIVSQFHSANLLVMDIKSKNILVVDDGTLKLFDYDSIVEIDQVHSGNAPITSPGEYYVPELDSKSDIRKIGKTVDIYEIGALFFQRLFHRPMEISEIQRRSVIPFQEAPLLKGVSPLILKELEVLFKHTLQVSPRFRYQDTAELKKQLEKILRLVRKESVIRNVCRRIERRALKEKNQDLLMAYRNLEEILMQEEFGLEEEVS